MIVARHRAPLALPAHAYHISHSLDLAIDIDESKPTARELLIASCLPREQRSEYAETLI